MALTVAILGAGIGAQHLEAYRALPERFHVKTLCDIDAARAASLLSAQMTCTTDQNAALTDPEIDLIDICLPPHLHFEACAAALRAGKHVICEKPLVPSLAETDRLQTLSEKTDRQIFPVFQYRYGPAATQLKALQAVGLTGKAHVATLETHWNRGAAYYATPWRGTWACEKGGAILTHAIHIHDWLSFALGPVAQVTALLATSVNRIEVEDCAALTLKMANGALVTSSVTLGAANDTTRIRLVFEGLTATSGTTPYAPANNPWTFTAHGPTTQAQIADVLANTPISPAGYVGFFQAISDHLRGSAAQVVTLADARHALELITAIYDSARSGQPVDLPLSNSHPMYQGWRAPDP